MNTSTHDAARVKAGVTLHFVEVRFDGIWTAVGAGHPTRQDADWSISRWRQDIDCRRETMFRVKEHTLAAPTPWDEEEMELTAQPLSQPADCK